MKLIEKKVSYLGKCAIDVYCEVGDLYESFDIVQIDDNGNLPRFPDARYGVNAPEYPIYNASNPPEIYDLIRTDYKFDDNGHTTFYFRIESECGMVFADRPY